MGQIHGENTYLTTCTQVRVPGTRKKYPCPKRKKILDDYDDLNTCVIVGSSRANNNFGHSGVQHHTMSFEASRAVSILSHNNNNTTAL